jgi:phosphohistidine phosphatase
MDLYLMQHGEAVPESEDAARPLSATGRADVERVARWAANLDLGIALVQHSGKLRARQTADLMASHLRPNPRVEETVGLAPNDEVAVLAGALRETGETRLLVGHLPHLARLTSTLVVGDPGRAVLAFRMGALVALRREAEGWRLRFVLTPEVVPA